MAWLALTVVGSSANLEVHAVWGQKGGIKMYIDGLILVTYVSFGMYENKNSFLLLLF